MLAVVTGVVAAVVSVTVGVSASTGFPSDVLPPSRLLPSDLA